MFVVSQTREIEQIWPQRGALRNLEDFRRAEQAEPAQTARIDSNREVSL